MVIKGRVDSINAQAFEEELMALCLPGEEVRIDAADLSYISSAGLRVFMKLKKAIKQEVFIENVSNEIYDIFEVTGFTEILTVEKKLREFDVTDCEVIEKYESSFCFRGNTEAFSR